MFTKVQNFNSRTQEQLVLQSKTAPLLRMRMRGHQGGDTLDLCELLAYGASVTPSQTDTKYNPTFLNGRPG